jgi:hypothetical protein
MRRKRTFDLLRHVSVWPFSVWPYFPAERGQFLVAGRAKSRLKEEFTPETASISYEFEAIRATVI